MNMASYGTGLPKPLLTCGVSHTPPTPTPTNTSVPPTFTPAPTNTPVSPTFTPLPPTDTPVITNTPLPPTFTPLPSTDTPTSEPTSQPGGALSLDAISSGTTATSGLAIPHTTSGSERLMLVGVSINNDNFEIVTSINYGGVPLTFVASEVQSDDARIEIWKLVNPPLGTHDLLTYFSADLRRYAVVGLITFTGADQLDPLGQFVGDNATTNSSSVIIPSDAGELVLGVFSCETCASVTFSSPGVERWNLAAGSGNEIGAGVTYEGAVTPMNISASLGARDHWALGGISIRPASSGLPEPTNTPTPTNTPVVPPTITPTPTNTPDVPPTNTPTPTNTPYIPPTNTPTPTIVPTSTPTSQPGGAPVVDAVSSGSTAGSSMSISHTASGSNRLMLVGVSINNDNSETVTSVTYNGIPLTYVDSETQSDDARVEIWKLVNPPTGTHNVLISFSTDLKRYAVAGVITFTGVNQTDPLGILVGDNATTNAASITIPSGATELVLGVFSCETCDSVSFTQPANEHWNRVEGSGDEIGTGVTYASDGSQVTLSASLGARDHWALGGAGHVTVTKFMTNRRVFLLNTLSL